MANRRYTLQEALKMFDLEDSCDDLESEVEEDDVIDVLPMSDAELPQGDISDQPPDIPVDDSDSEDEPSTSRDPMAANSKRRKQPKPPKIISHDFDFKWERIVKHHNVELYAQDPYIKNRYVHKNASPLSCFEALFTDDVFSLMTTMTNRNFLRKRSLREEKRLKTPKASRTHEVTWREITVPEMKAFTGLVIAMGVLRLPEIAMYWSNQSWLYRIPSFAEVMSRDRFRQINRHLHFSDTSTDETTTSQRSSSETEPEYATRSDKLRKIRTFLELVKGRILSEFVVGKNISIHESMIPFKGILGFRQFPQAKRTRYGIKVWALSDSETSYVTNFEVYVGRDPRDDTEDRFGLSGAVVLKLIEPFQQQGRCLYMDNFYTSPVLLEELYRLKTFACGTVRPSRKGFPKELVLTENGACRRPTGYTDWRMSDHIVCYCWNNYRPVYLMSTIHLPDNPDVAADELPAAKRRKRTSQRESRELPCPPPIKDYNKFMGTVCWNEQFRKHDNISRKTNIWYRKIFGYILEVAVHNSRVMLECAQKEKSHVVNFRQELSMALIGEYRAGRENTAKESIPVALRLDQSLPHLPIKVPDGRRRGCAFCSKRASAASKEGVKLNVQRCLCSCITCNVALCTNERDCFRKWHQCSDFWP